MNAPLESDWKTRKRRIDPRLDAWVGSRRWWGRFHWTSPTAPKKSLPLGSHLFHNIRRGEGGGSEASQKGFW